MSAGAYMLLPIATLPLWSTLKRFGACQGAHLCICRVVARPSSEPSWSATSPVAKAVREPLHTGVALLTYMHVTLPARYTAGASWRQLKPAWWCRVILQGSMSALNAASSLTKGASGLVTGAGGLVTGAGGYVTGVTAGAGKRFTGATQGAGNAIDRLSGGK